MKATLFKKYGADYFTRMGEKSWQDVKRDTSKMGFAGMNKNKVKEASAKGLEARGYRSGRVLRDLRKTEKK